MAEMVGAGIVNLPALVIDTRATYEPVVAGVAMGGGFYVAVWVIYHVSGAHINPILTLASLLTKRIKLCYLPLYFLAQFCGVLISTGIGMYISPFQTNATYPGMVFPKPEVTERQALSIEVLTSMMFCAVYLTTIDETRPANWALGSGVSMAMTMMFVQTGTVIIAVS